MQEESAPPVTCCRWACCSAMPSLMASNPARPSLRDGLRCLRRYPQIWLLPAGFALAHSGFRLWRRCYETWLVPGARSRFSSRGGMAAATLARDGSRKLAADCGKHGGHLQLHRDDVSALRGGGVVVPCELARLSGGLVSGVQPPVRRVRRRDGPLRPAPQRAWRRCANPCFSAGCRCLNGYFGAVLLLRLGEVVNSLSFLFEYLLGVGVQIYLVLLCFAWVRGLTFDFDALRRFALRRFAFVVKWAAVVMPCQQRGDQRCRSIASTFQPSGRLACAGLDGRCDPRYALAAQRDSASCFVPCKSC